MTQEPQKNNTVLIVIAIITVVGTIIASTIGAIGNYNTEKMRQEAELTRIALISGGATPKLITIILTNPSCVSLNYYVDGKLMVSSIEPKAKSTFDIIPGIHQVYVCVPNTNNCSDVVQVNWTTSTTAAIDPSTSCPITITLANPSCVSLNYYVDGRLKVSSVEPKAKSTFDIIPGIHQVYVCVPNTNNCSDKVQVNWTTSTTAVIDPSTSCPITITLTNSSCVSLNYYVDGKLKVSSVEPKAKSTFDIIPGIHQVYVCVPNTNNCSDKVQVNWTTSTTATIDPSTSCQ